MIKGGEMYMSAIASMIDTIGKSLTGWCRTNNAPYPVDISTGKMISNELFELANTIRETQNNPGSLEDVLSKPTQKQKETDSKYALEHSYEKAICCLRDSNFICNEKEYHGVNTLILQALKEIKAIGEITKINGVKDGAKKSSE